MPGPYSVVDFSCLIIPQTGLQYNAILKDRDLAEALFLGAGLLAGGNVQHELVQVGTGLVQRALAVRDDTGVKVDPGLFSGGQLAVGGNFQRRRGGTKRRAAARAEQHHVRTRSSQRRGGDQVVAWAVQHIQALGGDGLAVSKTVENEKDMLKVGYGAMILESLLAVLALCVAGAAAAADGTPAAGTPFQIFSRGVAGFFEMFGVPAYAATVFMTMCVSALALTSLDAVARIGRMSFQELFSVDDMEHAEGWRKLLCNVYFSTFLTLAFGFVLTKIGYANIWPLFGSANQLLSALVLATLCVFLKVTGRSNKMIFPPLIIMLCVTFTALVQRLIAMVKAISNAAAVTIPAGETTWGAVFIANGLQLILAVLLIVLGLNIVFHSFKAYKNAEHNSEAKV